MAIALPSSAEIQDALRNNDPAKALAAATSLVKKAPADPRCRVALFQLLVLTGQWDRALTQAKVAAEMDAGALPMARSFEVLIACEQLRERVMRARMTPLIMGEPPQWLASFFEALRLDNDGKHDAARQLRESALETVAAVPGRIDGQAFEWLSDADSRFGPALEVCISGKYYWVPYDQIRRIVIEAPADLRDFAWIPAEITLANAGQIPCFLPARYPGSEKHENGAVVLGRSTEWLEPTAGSYVGSGQRELASDVSTYPLLNCRLIEFDMPATAP